MNQLLLIDWPSLQMASLVHFVRGTLPWIHLEHDLVRILWQASEHFQISEFLKTFFTLQEIARCKDRVDEEELCLDSPPQVTMCCEGE
jgi:hypothetical protein